jgi:hypothetical protein
MTPTQKAAMEQALAKLEHLRVTIDSEWGECRDLDEIEIAGDQWQEVIDLRAALAEQDVSLIDEGKTAEPQEPVAWMYRTGGETRFSKTLNTPGMHRTESVPLYTAPQPRREVELTVNDILNLMPDSIPADHDGALIEFARAVIAAYRAKQGETK